MSQVSALFFAFGPCHIYYLALGPCLRDALGACDGGSSIGEVLLRFLALRVFST